MAAWILVASIPVAILLLLSGLDDLCVDFLWLRSKCRSNAPSLPNNATLENTPERPIAIFVPLWHEHAVLEAMLSNNIAAIRYQNYDWFIGVYPNDPLTIEAAQRAAQRFPNRVHICEARDPGPTSKADCLNWIYQRLLLIEEANGRHYDIVITHDAEDLVHPAELRIINYYARRYHFIQIPVLALHTPPLDLTHGLYCDEFAEMHTRDLAARASMGAFLPSAGVGTGYTRHALDSLAGADHNQIFLAECLTEDYENGLRLHRLGLSQLFLPLTRLGAQDNHTFLATGEYFPRAIHAAIRQRTRWVTGIALQAWQRNGWQGSWPTRYWLWRDRKCILTGPLGLITNILFALALVVPPSAVAANDATKALFATTFALGLLRVAMRSALVARVYGPAFAALVPLRIVWGNMINGIATLRAIRNFFTARRRGARLEWSKTTHQYPCRQALLTRSQTLGDILIRSGILTPASLEDALANKPEGLRLGEYLMRIQAIDEQQLCHALALQLQLLVAGPAAGPTQIRPKVARTLPANFIEQWRIIPFAIDERGIHLCSPEAPPPQLAALLRSYTPLEAHFYLTTPQNFEDLMSRFVAPRKQAERTSEIAEPRAAKALSAGAAG